MAILLCNYSRKPLMMSQLIPHMLWVDGLYDVKDQPVFHELPPPSDEEIRVLVETLSARILKALKRKGYPVDDEANETPATGNVIVLGPAGASI